MEDCYQSTAEDEDNNVQLSAGSLRKLYFARSKSIGTRRNVNKMDHEQVEERAVGLTVAVPVKPLYLSVE